MVLTLHNTLHLLIVSRSTAHLLIAPTRRFGTVPLCLLFSFASNTTGRDCAVAGGVVVACGGAWSISLGMGVGEKPRREKQGTLRRSASYRAKLGLLAV